MKFLFFLGLTLFVTGFLLPAVAAPILYMARRPRLRRPRFENFHPHELPPAVRKEFDRAVQRICGDGFELLNYLSWTSAPPERSYFAVFRRSATGDLGVSVVTLTGNTLRPVSERYFLFRRGYKNDFAIVSHCNGAGDFPWDTPGTAYTCFPRMKDPHHLLVLHERRIAQFARGMETVAVPPGEETGVICRTILASHERLVSRKFVKPDSRGGHVTPTCKGALRLAREKGWPLALLHRSRRRRRAGKEMARLLAHVPSPDAAENEK